MKHFIIEITYLIPFEQIRETVPAHRAFLQSGYDCGWLLMSGPQNPLTGGIVVARAPDLEALQAFFQDDPYRQHSLASYRFMEFNPVKRQAFMDEWSA
jgi:uncharacterized protein YciI